ncbi:tiny macrocysts protein B [Haematococcus lacustris]|uniref:Tiny macrocysts protein B n=1 Tax=Haematococcus lacustris TaxID=44745 RepID=A0A699YXT2_HAELA|nr:tiny macrocysts protein B [Haematococcus lacustris]
MAAARANLHLTCRCCLLPGAAPEPGSEHDPHRQLHHGAVDLSGAGADGLQDCQPVWAAAEVQEQLTLVMWVGLVPAGLAGALAGWMRLRYFMETVLDRFRRAPPNMEPRLIFKFTDAREQVEILSRCCRVWDPLDEQAVDDAAVALAGVVLKASPWQHRKWY